jgi:ubiquinone/menaquinone biosynthesis C-methylase UbiE
LREAAHGAARLLEVGIGTGRMAVPLAARGARVTGIDISPAMLNVLRGKRRDIDAVLAEAARPPFRERAFDATLFVHILHLVPDAEATIRAAIRMVRPGGLIIAGSDAPREGIRDEAEAIIRACVAEVTGIDLGGWKPYEDTQTLLERLMVEAHAVDVARRSVSWTASVSAEGMLERLERRDFSSSWRIPAEHMQAVVDRVRPRLIALFGDRGDVDYERSFLYRAWRLT